MLDKKAKQKIINKFKIHDNDTGSTQVQAAILTEEIKDLSDHLKRHKHDHSSRRGLLKKVSERRRLLKYLQKEDELAFNELAKKLKLKIAKKRQTKKNILSIRKGGKMKRGSLRPPHFNINQTTKKFINSRDQFSSRIDP